MQQDQQDQQDKNSLVDVNANNNKVNSNVNPSGNLSDNKFGMFPKRGNSQEIQKSKTEEQNENTGNIDSKGDNVRNNTGQQKTTCNVM